MEGAWTSLLELAHDSLALRVRLPPGQSGAAHFPKLRAKSELAFPSLTARRACPQVALKLRARRQSRPRAFHKFCNACTTIHHFTSPPSPKTLRAASIARPEAHGHDATAIEWFPPHIP
jgi:hypothetical protein